MSEDNKDIAKRIVAGMKQNRNILFHKALELNIGFILCCIINSNPDDFQSEGVPNKFLGDCAHKVMGFGKGIKAEADPEIARLAKKLRHFHADSPLMARMAEVLETFETSPFKAHLMAQNWLSEVCGEEEFEADMSATFDRTVVDKGIYALDFDVSNELRDFPKLIAELFPTIMLRWCKSNS